jgi:hypothetical protein
LDLLVYRRKFPFFYKKVYFDSYGVFPPTNEILDYLKPKNDTLLNDKQIQSYNESTCGEYCLYVLYKLNNGENFIDVLTPFGDYLNGKELLEEKLQYLKKKTKKLQTKKKYLMGISTSLKIALTITSVASIVLAGVGIPPYIPLIISAVTGVSTGFINNFKLLEKQQELDDRMRKLFAITSELEYLISHLQNEEISKDEYEAIINRLNSI